MKAKKIFKNVLLGLGIVLFCMIVFVAVYIYRVELDEFIYLNEPNDKNLIRLAVNSIKVGDYDKMIRYLPQTVEIDDIEEIVLENKIFIRNYSEKSDAARKTYYTILEENALMYLYVEKYDEFLEIFPNAYKKIINAEAIMSFTIWISVSDRITENGYENLVSALEDNRPILLEIKKENYWEIIKYVHHLILEEDVYYFLGDTESRDRLIEESDQIIDELMDLAVD